jgi:hypothetical protein
MAPTAFERYIDQQPNAPSVAKVFVCARAVLEFIGVRAEALDSGALPRSKLELGVRVWASLLWQISQGTRNFEC